VRIVSTEGMATGRVTAVTALAAADPMLEASPDGAG
jgi:hypothetical protein